MQWNEVVGILGLLGIASPILANLYFTLKDIKNNMEAHKEQHHKDIQLGRRLSENIKEINQNNNAT